MITFSNLGKPEWGRLGNQLFQIAATLGIAHRNKQEAVFPEWKYSKYLANSLKEGYPSHCKEYKEKNHFYNLVDLSPGDWDLKGFFQSEKYFVNVEDSIRALLTPSSEVTEYINKKYGRVLDNNICSIHVRRGDYLKLSLAFPPQPIEYYYQAIKQFSSDTRFLVFSDDMDWCRKNFRGDRFDFVDQELDIIDLMTMSRCKHHIISNSSFSWWGAWLNSNPEKIVLSPYWWFGPAVTTRPRKRTRDIYARGFKPVILPTEQLWLTHLYYTVLGPFFMLYFNIYETKHKLMRSKPVKNIINKLKSI